MGQSDDNFDRLLAIQKLIGEKLAVDADATLDSLKRWADDPGMEHLRPLIETFVGLLPISLKAERGDVWGVAKGGNLWARAYRDDFDTFYFGIDKVESGAHGEGFSYEVREDIIVIWDPKEPECNVIFRYGGNGVWSKKLIRSDATVVAVRRESVVQKLHKEAMVGCDVSTVREVFADDRVQLYDLPACNGVQAGEDWLVAWRRDNTTLTLHLVSGDYKETLVVDNTTGDPTVFAPMTNCGRFVNITVAVETLGVDEEWACGTRINAVRHNKSEVVVNAFVLDGNCWQWHRRAGQERGGIVAVNGKDTGTLYVTGIEVKGGVVCIACGFGGEVKVGKPTLVRAMLPDGTANRLPDSSFDSARWREQFASWPVVLDNRGLLVVVLKAGGELTVRNVLEGVDSVHRNGQHLFVQMRTERNRWMVMTYDMNTLEQTGKSLNGRGKFDLMTAVVTEDGALFAAMQRSDKWVTIVGPRGQYGHDYHEVKCLAVADGFVTFNGCTDRKVVRVRVPV